MQDTQIIGNGASRLLKGPPNAVSLYPDFASWLADFAEKGIPCDLSNLQAQGVKVFGTGYSKANCLPDSLETALWGGKGNHTIAHALDKLRSLIVTTDGKIPKIISGSYVGTATLSGTDGYLGQKIQLGFRPKLLVVVQRQRHNTSATEFYYNFAIGSGQNIILMNYNKTNYGGYVVPETAGSITDTYITLSYLLNLAQTPYDYIAIG